ncbi:DUF3015 family protein [Salinisphaera sp. Q1T1-3]|uniref:DUF3015 family protein n=1 Tax=Salinisphaera sp. Q1T1-3 TaxID=2321229 RepID=UPI0013148CD0|nr:DUF3015 family protein [Salinisphaera sp. Q1T1-3]
MQRFAWLLGIAVLGAALTPNLASALDRRDFTTTASTAGTTAYIVGKHDKDDLARAHDFADNQHLALQREAARGQGEHLAALAALLERDPVDFGPWMQSHYAALYPASAAHSANLVDRITALHAS